MPMHLYTLSACLEPLAPVNEQQIKDDRSDTLYTKIYD